VGKLSRKPKPSVDDFIAGAVLPTPKPFVAAPPPPAYPWEDPKVRDDVLKVYNLRLPEPYLLKLKHIAENTPGSMQKFCLDALLPAIDAKIAELARKG
jgi:hypothetical protein